MRPSFYFLIMLLLSVAVATPLKAQSEKVPLSFDDVRQWRTHSISLSDDGKWYTTVYELFDKPEKTDTASENGMAEKVKALLTEGNQTDVLYISHAKDGIRYRIPRGTNPKFSDASDWVAYRIENEDEDQKDEKATSTIELRHLSSGYTVKYESNASYRFLEDKPYFITSDKSSLLVYDLENRREHYIGNLGEYHVDKKSDYIVYTIASEDKRGNGIYLYDPAKMTTRALLTGNFNYSKISWNDSKTGLAAYQYTKTEDKVDYDSTRLLLISNLESVNPAITQYPINEIKDLPEEMSAAVKSRSSSIVWSKDGKRLFIKIKKIEDDNESEIEDVDKQEGATVQVWHWKDKKLLSERIIESERKQNEVFDALFFIDSNRLVQLTGEEVQVLNNSPGTDNWAIGSDNRKYISDWDITRNDLYRINLKTGAKKLIEENYSSRYSSGLEISPDGEKAILWDGEHFWCYDFASDTKQNITAGLEVSFVDQDYDYYGYKANYGFVGWVKGQQAVIVNHKHDLWLLPIDKKSQAQNLTASLTADDPIRVRFEDYSFAYEPEIEDRYLDLSSPNFLYAFNTQTKHAGYYSLQKGKLKKLIYGPNGYADPYRRYGIIKSEKSDAIIFKKGDYQNYPEAYLSNADFSKPKKITDTNPQQDLYKWGKRVLFDYTNDDGIPLQGILSIPDSYKKGDKLPMIVYSYEKLSDGMYNYTIPYLNGATVPEMLYVSEDYLFLRPDIHFNIGTPHSDMLESIDAAIEKVIEMGYVDENRIGYEGFSFGGHCGMYMSTQPNKFAAIAAGAGVSNLVQGFNLDIVRDGSNEQDYYMTGQGRLGTDPTSNIDMFIRESPVFNAATMETPLLLFHGTADNVVQWEHSFGFYSILRYLKKQVVFLSYLGEGHGMRQEANRLDIQRRLKDYFDHYLKGAEIKKWMTEELPYVPNKDAEGKRKLPKWK